MVHHNILNKTNELKRKKIHLLSFFIPLFYIICPNYILLFTSIILSITLFIDLSRLYLNSKINSFFYNHLFSTIREYEKKELLSATWLIITFFLVIILFDKAIAIYAISIGALCDSFAAIIGLKYGVIKNHLNKSLEGSLGFVTVGFFIIIIHMILFPSNLLILVFCLLIVTTIEFFTPSKYDNILVPLSAAFFLNIFNIL